MTPRKAVNKALKDVNFQRVNDQAVRNLVLAAACTGYGVWPHMLTAVSQKNITDTLLSDSWAADNVKLSRRLHTMDVERLAAQTIQTAIKRAPTVRAGGVGAAAWAAFAFWLHAAWIGVAPFPRG